MNLTFRPILKLVVAFFCALTGSLSAADAGEEAKPVRHFVAFQFKSSTTAEEIDAVVAAFIGMKKDIREIQSIEAGPNNSPEQLNKGLTHAFLVTFAGAKDRDAYLVHPAHMKFKEFAKPFVSDLLVIDFTNNK